MVCVHTLCVCFRFSSPSSSLAFLAYSVLLCLHSIIRMQVISTPGMIECRTKEQANEEQMWMNTKLIISCLFNSCTENGLVNGLPLHLPIWSHSSWTLLFVPNQRHNSRSFHFRNSRQRLQSIFSLKFIDFYFPMLFNFNTRFANMSSFMFSFIASIDFPIENWNLPWNAYVIHEKFPL